MIASPAADPAPAPSAPEAAREALVRALPWLERRSAGCGGARALERREELVQATLTAALARIEGVRARSGAAPEWCLDDQRLRRYLGGMLKRLHQRQQREASVRRAVTLRREPVDRESSLESAEACACLAQLAAAQQDLWPCPSEAKDLAERARERGCTAAALAKRRARALRRLRERCRTCSIRIEQGCALAPSHWSV